MEQHTLDVSIGVGLNTCASEPNGPASSITDETRRLNSKAKVSDYMEKAISVHKRSHLLLFISFGSLLYVTIFLFLFS